MRRQRGVLRMCQLVADQLSPERERQIIALTVEGIGGAKIIAKRIGCSHTTVIRVWERAGIDRHKLAGRNHITRQFTALAITIARNVGRGIPAHMREDLIGVAYIALIEAAASYRPDVQGEGHAKPVSFPAYAQQRIRGACIDSIRRRHYLNANAGELTPDAAESRVDSRASTEAELIENQTRSHNRARLATAVLNLPGRHAVITWLHYLEDRPIERIALDLGVGASRVSQLHTEALGMMRANLGVR